MGLEFIRHNGIEYPVHEATGNAARWIMPMALEYCKGFGFDIGANRKEWALPGCFMMIDPAITPELNAMTIPCDDNYADYIFSSHCLEHIKENWYNILDYWLTKIHIGGIIFLYLPHKSQTYWHPSSNRKHVHSFDGSEIGDYLRSLGHKVFVGGCDANHSFIVICEKMEKSVYERSPLVDFMQQIQTDMKQQIAIQKTVAEKIKEAFEVNGIPPPDKDITPVEAKALTIPFYLHSHDAKGAQCIARNETDISYPDDVVAKGDFKI